MALFKKFKTLKAREAEANSLLSISDKGIWLIIGSLMALIYRMAEGTLILDKFIGYIVVTTFVSVVFVIYLRIKALSMLEALEDPKSDT